MEEKQNVKSRWRDEEECCRWEVQGGFSLALELALPSRCQGYVMVSTRQGWGVLLGHVNVLLAERKEIWGDEIEPCHSNTFHKAVCFVDIMDNLYQT